MTTGVVLEARELHYAYGREEVLSGVGLRVCAGDFLVVIGPNGAGKSTLLRLLAGLLAPTRGLVLLEGRSLSELSRREIARKVAWVPQSISFPFSFTVREFVEMSRHPHRGPLSGLSRRDEEAVSMALERVEASGLASRPIGAISGGERQRVLLAAAIAQEAEVLLLDEPSASLDPRHAIEAYDLLLALVELEHRTVVTVTHDLVLAARCARSALLLEGGRVVSHGEPAEVLREEAMERVYRVTWKRVEGPLGPVLLPARPVKT